MTTAELAAAGAAGAISSASDAADATASAGTSVVHPATAAGASCCFRRRWRFRRTEQGVHCWSGCGSGGSGGCDAPAALRVAFACERVCTRAEAAEAAQLAAAADAAGGVAGGCASVARVSAAAAAGCAGCCCCCCCSGGGDCCDLPPSSSTSVGVSCTVQCALVISQLRAAAARHCTHGGRQAVLWQMVRFQGNSMPCSDSTPKTCDIASQGLGAAGLPAS